MASTSDNSAVGMPQLDFSTFPNQIFWLVVFCVVLFAIVKFFIIPRMEDIFANRRKIIDGNIAKAEEIRIRVSEIEKQIEDELMANRHVPSKLLISEMYITMKISDRPFLNHPS